MNGTLQKKKLFNYTTIKLFLEKKYFNKSFKRILNQHNIK